MQQSKNKAPRMGLRAFALGLAIAASGAFGGCAVYPQPNYAYYSAPPTYAYSAPRGIQPPYPAQPAYYGGQAYGGQSHLAYEQQRYASQQQAQCSGSSLNAGTLIGGAAGGLAGSTIGRGKGRMAAIAAGALLGGMAGTQVANGGCR